MDITKQLIEHLDNIGAIVSKKMVTEDSVAREVRNVMRTTGFDLVATAKAPADEIHKMITLSPAHVSRETAAKIEARWRNEKLPVIYDKETSGWFFATNGHDQNDEVGYPDDLRAILTYARARGCTWIMLDTDGPVVAGLPTWEW